MLGIDVAPAQALVVELTMWQSRIDGIEVLLAEAETLSDLATPGRDRLGRIARNGTAMATTVDTATDELLAHRTRIRSAMAGATASNSLLRAGGFTSFMARQGAYDPASEQAQELIDRLRRDTKAGRAPNRDDHERLQAIFDETIRDDEAAAAALGLALGGLPASLALGFGSVPQIEATLDAVKVAMTAGTPPQKTDIPLDFFPPAYVEWHVVNGERERIIEEAVSRIERSWRGLNLDPVEEIKADVAALDARLERIALRGLEDDQFLIGDAGVVAPVAAAVSITAFHGPSTRGWLGATLAPEFGRRGETNDMLIGRLAANDHRTALRFFNGLGAEQSARIPEQLLLRGPEHLSAALPLFSSALATVSGERSLDFSGADLIRADTLVGRGWNGYATWANAELLLLQPGFDERFLLDAVVESLTVRPNDAADWPSGFGPRGDLERYDPRGLALQAVVMNDAADALVANLDETQRLELLLDPASFGNFGAESPALAGLPVSPMHQLLAQAARNPLAAEAVVDHIASNPARYDRPFRDLRIANGVSALLALSVGAYAQPGPRQEQFIGVYQLVLESGAGLDVSLASNNLLEREVQSQLEAGNLDADLGTVGSFIGQLDQQRTVLHRGDAALRDKAASNFNGFFSVATGVGGLVATGLGLAFAAAGPVAVATGVALGLFGLAAALFGPASQSLARWLAGENETKDRLSRIVNRQVTLGALRSGRVRTLEGHGITLVEQAVAQANGAQPSYQVLDDVTGSVLYQGDFVHAGDGPFKIDVFDELGFTVQVDGHESKSLREVLDRLDNITDIQFPQIED